MPSNVTHRTDIRQVLAALLETALVGTGKPADVVYRYRKSKIDKNFAICVCSSNVNREKQAQPTRVTNYIDLEIMIFTIYAADNFTEEQSEDKADDLEKAVSDVLMDNDSTDDWEQLAFNGDSEYDVAVLVNGKTYRIETIPVRILLHSE